MEPLNARECFVVSYALSRFAGGVAVPPLPDDARILDKLGVSTGRPTGEALTEAEARRLHAALVRLTAGRKPGVIDAEAASIAGKLGLATLLAPTP